MRHTTTIGMTVLAIAGMALTGCSAIPTNTATETAAATASSKVRSTTENAAETTTTTPDEPDEDKVRVGMNVDDLTTVGEGEMITYRGSGKYKVTWGSLKVDEELSEAFDERRICMAETIEIERYGVPGQPDGFLGGWVYGAHVPTSSVHKQALLAAPHYAVFTVGTDGTIVSGGGVGRPSSAPRDVPDVNHNPDQSTRRSCFTAPEDVNQVLIVPHFDAARAMSFEADDPTVDGWLLTLPAAD